MSYQITMAEVGKMAASEYILVDVRDEISYYHGFIPGAVHRENSTFLQGELPFEKSRKIILYCMKVCLPFHGQLYHLQHGWRSGIETNGD